MRSIIATGILLAVLAWAGGCQQTLPPPKPYGTEMQLYVPGKQQVVWAVAPAINLSGQSHVDALLQADLVFAELQQVHGVTAIPVNRVVEIYARLHIEKVESPEQASLVCDLLGCDALVVPTVTAFDPYDPPKLGASLQLFRKPGRFMRPPAVDLQKLDRAAQEPPVDPMNVSPDAMVQVVGMFDASDGSVRDSVKKYAQGRNDPQGPFGDQEFMESMDRYCGFVYHQLLADLLDQPQLKRS
jgi:hypothetical protein